MNRMLRTSFARAFSAGPRTLLRATPLDPLFTVPLDMDTRKRELYHHGAIQSTSELEVCLLLNKLTYFSV
jgi:hypothetical protein